MTAISIAAALRKIRSLLRLRLINSAYGPRALGQKNDPHQRLDTLERVSGWGTLIILAGIALEIWMFFALGPHDPRERTGALIANCLIAVGLIMEYVAIRLTIVASGEAKAESDLKIAELNARAEEANQKAQESALELARLKAPRVLWADQSFRVSEKLKPHAGTTFCVAVQSFDPEFLNLIGLIEFALKSAGWVQIDWFGPGRIRRGLPVIGVDVAVTNVVVSFPAGDPILQSPAKTLADALTAEGIEAPTVVGVMHSSCIHIMVGRKT